jgi:transposase
VRPKVARQVVRESSYVYAAVAPEQGLMTSLILPSANTAMMNLFLAEASRRLCRLLYCHASRVMRAGTGPKTCRWKTNIRLIFQPASSPELNPVEHLWEELREKYLHNRVFPSLEELIEVLCQALTELTEEKERLRSMMFFPHFRMES